MIVKKANFRGATSVNFGLFFSDFHKENHACLVMIGWTKERKTIEAIVGPFFLTIIDDKRW